MSITIDNDVTQTLSADRPKKRWLYLEPSRTLGELAAWPISKQLLKLAPKGDGHPVIALPGFMAGDSSTGILRNFLSSRGYAALPWELGATLAPMYWAKNLCTLRPTLKIRCESTAKRSVL